MHGAGAPGGCAPRGACGVLAAHRGRTLALAARADMRFSLFLLLIGLALCLLALGFGEAAPSRGSAVVFRRSRFTHGDGDGLLAALDLAALAARSAFELAMFEFMHDASRRFPLAWG